MATDDETGFELRLGSLTGCVMLEGHPFTVETVAEARVAILQYAMDLLDHHAHQSEKREYLRLNVGVDGPTWDDLVECEEGRRYDPSRPEEGMRCSYFLYQEGGLEGVGGLMWTYSVTIWATAPPEVWDHPADRPIGLDSDDDLRNDYRPDPATNDSSELEGRLTWPSPTRQPTVRSNTRPKTVSSLPRRLHGSSGPAARLTVMTTASRMVSSVWASAVFPICQRSRAAMR